MKKLLCIFVFMIFTLSANALDKISTWQIQPEMSNITFTAIQNNAPVSGKFKVFAADITGDPHVLDKSHVKIIVNTDSVATDYALVADTLKTKEWLDVKAFPQAIFEASDFKETGKNTYQASGTLNLRGKTLPLALDFDLKSYTPQKIEVQGSAMIKRTAFGVGQGDFAKTDEIKDNITIHFSILLIKK